MADFPHESVESLYSSMEVDGLKENPRMAIGCVNTGLHVVW